MDSSKVIIPPEQGGGVGRKAACRDMREILSGVSETLASTKGILIEMRDEEVANLRRLRARKPALSKP